MDRIKRSPLRGMKKPKARRREAVVTADEYAELLAFFPSQEVKDILTIAWETGARPQEITAVEARHLDAKSSRWVFPVEESKGKTFPRVVYLSETALAVCKRLANLYPTGPLFRNTDGEPWNRHSLGCVFGRFQVAQGLRRLKELGLDVEKVPRFDRRKYTDPLVLEAAKKEQEKKIFERRKKLYKLARRHGRKISLYLFRHAWGTRAIQNGVDPLTVAILMGHADPSTLAKVYQHLAHDPEFLRNSAKKARG